MKLRRAWPFTVTALDYYDETTAQKSYGRRFSLLCPFVEFRSQQSDFKSGGFIASGEVAPDRYPSLYRPQDGKLIGSEGTGEVQTPIKVADSSGDKLGDPFFFRPAKAGEIAEHFNHYVLFRDEKVEEIVPTYRGLGLNLF